MHATNLLTYEMINEKNKKKDFIDTLKEMSDNIFSNTK